jgi:gliding motility-associated-like protein
VTDANGCTATASITIIVNNPPEVTITSDAINNTICEGESATLTANVSQGTAPFSYLWDDGSTGVNRVVSPSSTTTYSVTVTDASGCEGTGTITIVVNERPIAMVSAARDTICAGEAAQLSAMATGGSGGYTFRWSNGFEGVTQSVMPSATTTYSVTATDSSGCSSDAAEITIVVRPTPEVDAGADQAACKGEPVILTATITSGTAPYVVQWSNGFEGLSQIVNPTEPTTYVVSVTDVNGCSATDAVFVDVLPRPDDFPPDTVQACANTPTRLNPNGNPNLIYEWSPANILDDPTAPNPLVTTNEDVQVFVTITYPNTGCFFMDTVQVRVAPPIGLEISFDTLVCQKDFILLANTAASGVQIVWADNPEFDPILGTGNQVPVVLPFGETRYYARATDASGCTQTDSFLIESYPVEATLPSTTVICLPTDPVILTVTNLDPQQNLTYNWSPSNGIIGSATGATVQANPQVASRFSVSIQNQFGCNLELASTIVIIDLPRIVNVAANPDTIFAGQTSQLNASGCNLCTFEWSPGGTLSNPRIANPVATPTETTDYTLTVTQGECVATFPVRVVVINAICDKDHIYLPTAFTPNGDGQNDIWQLRSTFLDELLSVELIVYNRWGQKVFETRNPRIGWDGTFRNEQLPPDVYGYYLRVVCPGQEELVQKGNVTLLR